MLKDDMQEAEAIEDEVFAGSAWTIHCGEPDGKRQKKKKNHTNTINKH